MITINEGILGSNNWKYEWDGVIRHSPSFYDYNDDTKEIFSIVIYNIENMNLIDPKLFTPALTHKRSEGVFYDAFFDVADQYNNDPTYQYHNYTGELYNPYNFDAKKWFNHEIKHFESYKFAIICNRVIELDPFKPYMINVSDGYQIGYNVNGNIITRETIPKGILDMFNLVNGESFFSIYNEYPFMDQYTIQLGHDYIQRYDHTTYSYRSHNEELDMSHNYNDDLDSLRNMWEKLYNDPFSEDIGFIYSKDFVDCEFSFFYVTYTGIDENYLNRLYPDYDSERIKRLHDTIVEQNNKNSIDNKTAFIEYLLKQGGDDGMIPTLPTLGIQGIATIYEPTVSEATEFIDYCYSTSFLDKFLKLFVKPLDALMMFSIMPVKVPIGGRQTIAVFDETTLVESDYVANQFYSVNCGSVTIHEDTNSYLDYDNTKVEIFLPYIGFKTLNTKDVMGKSINVLYNIDVLTGVCIAFIIINGFIINSFEGNIAYNIPLTSTDNTRMITGLLQASVTGGAAVATGGSSLIMASAANSAIGALGNMKPDIDRAGSLGSNIGYIGYKKPYVLVTRPKADTILNQNTFEGFPSYKNVLMSNLSGFFKVESVHLTNIDATDNEINEIETLLKEGVIV